MILYFFWFATMVYWDPGIFNFILFIMWYDLAVQAVLAKRILSGYMRLKCSCGKEIGPSFFFTVAAFRIKWHEKKCLIGLVNGYEEGYKY